jgi:hypothetical protein
MRRVVISDDGTKVVIGGTQTNTYVGYTYYSSNSGSAWTPLATTTSTPTAFMIGKLLATSTLAKVYCADGSSPSHFLVSTDLGATWASTTVPSTLNLSAGDLGVNASGTIVTLNAMTPGMTPVRQSWISRDSGATFTQLQ